MARNANEAEKDEAIRKRRAAAKLEAQKREEEEDKDESSIWELKYVYPDPVGIISVAEDWSGEGSGIAGLQWLGGVLLTRYMDSRKEFPEDFFYGKRVIELGAGIGLTSIYTAIRGADTVITDMDIEKCRENVEANLQPRGLQGRVIIKKLVWAETDLTPFAPPYDVVLAGDCLYQMACVQPLLETMWGLSGKHTLVLVSGAVGEDIFEYFLANVDRCFSLERIRLEDVDTLSSRFDSDELQAPKARAGTRGLFRLTKKEEKG